MTYEVEEFQAIDVIFSQKGKLFKYGIVTGFHITAYTTSSVVRLIFMAGKIAW